MVDIHIKLEKNTLTADDIYNLLTKYTYNYKILEVLYSKKSIKISKKTTSELFERLAKECYSIQANRRSKILLTLLDIDDDRKIDNNKFLEKWAFYLLKHNSTVSYKIIQFEDDRKINLFNKYNTEMNGTGTYMNFIEHVYFCYFGEPHTWIIKYCLKQNKELYNYILKNEERLVSCIDNPSWKRAYFEDFYSYPESLPELKEFMGENYEKMLNPHLENPYDIFIPVYKWYFNHKDSTYVRKASILRLFQSIQHLEFDSISGTFDGQNAFPYLKKLLLKKLQKFDRMYNLQMYDLKAYDVLRASGNSSGPACNSVDTIKNINNIIRCIPDYGYSLKEAIHEIRKYNSSMGDKLDKGSQKEERDMTQKLDLKININGKMSNINLKTPFYKDFIYSMDNKKTKEDILFHELTTFMNNLYDECDSYYNKCGSEQLTTKHNINKMDFKIKRNKKTIYGKFTIELHNDSCLIREVGDGKVTYVVGCYWEIEHE